MIMDHDLWRYGCWPFESSSVSCITTVFSILVSISYGWRGHIVVDGYWGVVVDMANGRQSVLCVLVMVVLVVRRHLGLVGHIACSAGSCVGPVATLSYGWACGACCVVAWRVLHRVLSLGHVPLVLLLLVPLFVLVGHILVFDLHLGCALLPPYAQLLGYVSDACSWLLGPDGGAHVVREPHECVNAPLGRVGVLLGPLTHLPPAGVRSHLVLALLPHKSLLIVAGHGVVLVPHSRGGLGPASTQLLANLADGEVWILYPHVGTLLGREVHEPAEGSFGSVRVPLGPALLVAAVGGVVVLGLLALEPCLVRVGHLFEHGLGDVVQVMPPPAQLLGDVCHGEVGVGLLDLGAAHVGEVEEAGEGTLGCVGVPAEGWRLEQRIARH